MAVTYEPIATTTASGSTTSVTFSSISGSYTDLRLVITGTTSANANEFAVRVNGDTGSNYSYTWMRGNGTTATSSRSTSATSFLISGWSSNTTPLSGFADFMNYSNTTTNKTMITRGNDMGNGYVQQYVALWRSTAAITSITILTLSGANLSNNCIFTLYGIKAA